MSALAGATTTGKAPTFFLPISELNNVRFFHHHSTGIRNFLQVIVGKNL
ncbi:hypothetical protein [Pantoea ananatis]